MNKLGGVTLRRFIIISVFLLLIIGVVIGYFLLRNIKYNNELDIGPFDKLSMYQFEEGIGFIDKEGNSSQKEAVIKLIRDLKPCEKVEQDDEYTKVGGYFAFCFKKDSIRTNFVLKELTENVLSVAVSKINTEGKVINQSYFTSSVDLAEKIENVIIIR